MADAQPAPEDLRALLVTHNVCGVFDHMGSALSCWVQELQALVFEQTAGTQLTVPVPLYSLHALR